MSKSNKQRSKAVASGQTVEPPTPAVAVRAPAAKEAALAQLPQEQQIAPRTPAERDAAIAELPEEQQIALMELIRGETSMVAGQAAGVTRRTVERWKNENPAFKALFHEWRDEMRETCRTRLLGLGGRVISTLDKALLAGDVKVAMALAKGLDLMNPGEKVAIDPEVVALQNELDRRRKISKLTEEIQEQIAHDQFVAEARTKLKGGG
jgi:hypothetical protein